MTSAKDIEDWMSKLFAAAMQPWQQEFYTVMCNTDNKLTLPIAGRRPKMLKFFTAQQGLGKPSRKRRIDKFGYAARKTKHGGRQAARSTRSPTGMTERRAKKIAAAHAARYPANVRVGTYSSLVPEFDKELVLFTIREGGTWQKWPWNYVPQDCDLAIESWPHTIASLNKMPIFHSDGQRAVYVHSLLIDGKRWDCINGWNQ